MDLTAANTAIVVDSTADFPQAPQRFPNWRIVPLYVRFGAESFRDYVELTPADFYARLRMAEELGGGNVRTVDTGTASAGVAMLGLAIQRRLERGTTDEEIDELLERYERDAHLIFTVD